MKLKAGDRGSLGEPESTRSRTGLASALTGKSDGMIACRLL